MSAWKPRLRATLPYAVPCLAFLAIVLAIFWRVWTGIDGARKAFGWDAQWEYWGDLQFLWDALRRGEVPLWNPWDRGGYPYHADPQVGVLYPLNWLLLGVAAAAGPAWWLVTVKVLLHFWLGSVGMYAFLRRRRLPLAACYAGGVFFILAYPFSHAMFAALNWGMAWAPWVLLAVDAWAERPSPGRAAGVALALGMCQLAGAPASFWYTLCVAVPYGAWALAHQARAAGEGARAYLKTAAWTTALAGGLFVAMVAAQFTATSNLVAHTVRDQRTLDFIGGGAFSADDLFGFLVPRMPGEGPFITYVMLFGAAVALTVRPTARALVLGGVAVAGVLLSWGSDSGMLPLAASAMPPFGFFRRAQRYLFVTMTALAILGADGLATLVTLEGEEARRKVGRAILVAGALGVVVFGCGVVATSKLPNRPEEFRDAYALAFASVIVSAWVMRQTVAKDGQWRRVFAAIAAVVMGLNLWYSRHNMIEKNWYPIPKAQNDKDARALAGVPLETRVYDREHLKFRPGIRLQIRDLGGYEGDPLALSRFAKLLKLVQAEPKQLGHANVRYLLEGPKSYTKPTVLGKSGLKAVRGGIHEVPAVAPAVMWVDRATVVDGDEDAALAALRGTRPGTAAVLERAALSPGDAVRAVEGDAAAPVVAGRILELGLNRVVAEIDAPADGVVVIHESYYPGWEARVDGQPARLFPANVLFRGLLVGPGKHRIELRYRAPAYTILAAVSFAALIAALLLWIRQPRTAAAQRAA